MFLQKDLRIPSMKRWKKEQVLRKMVTKELSWHVCDITRKERLEKLTFIRDNEGKRNRGRQNSSTWWACVNGWLNGRGLAKGQMLLKATRDRKLRCATITLLLKKFNALSVWNLLFILLDSSLYWTATDVPSERKK